MHTLADNRLSDFSPATATHGPRVCVIAEIGVNHDGRLGRAIELVHAAKDAGADAVKFQLFEPRWLLSGEALLADYQKRQGQTDPFEMLHRLALNAQQMGQVRKVAHEVGLGFVLTPFSLENVPVLKSLDVDAVKIASPDVVNWPLLKRTAALGKPMLVSTGTADLDELAFAARIISDQPCCLLHCVSSYPTPLEQASLGAIGAIRQRFGLPVGYSDHTQSPTGGAFAAAAGACVIEKHLTYDCEASGPDHQASFEPDAFARYVQAIRQAETMMGPTCKKVCAVERQTRAICRQSVCVNRDLPAGYLLEAGDLTLKRPGTGIMASQFEQVPGHRLAKAVKAGQLLHREDLVGFKPTDALSCA